MKSMEYLVATKYSILFVDFTNKNSILLHTTFGTPATQGYRRVKQITTVWSSELDTLLMRYGVKFTSYRIKSVSNSLDQTVVARQFKEA